MLIEEMLKQQETKIKESMIKEKKSFNDIFDILDYYLFNSDKTQDRFKQIKFKCQRIKKSSLKHKKQQTLKIQRFAACSLNY